MRGLLRRQRDDEDERQVRIYLTEEGRALREKALTVPLAVGKALGGDGEAAGMLRESLHRLREQLDASGDS